MGALQEGLFLLFLTTSLALFVGALAILLTFVLTDLTWVIQAPIKTTFRGIKAIKTTIQATKATVLGTRATMVGTTATMQGPEKGGTNDSQPPL